jgi:hypothetical protein
LYSSFVSTEDKTKSTCAAKSGFTGPSASLVADGRIESPPDTEKFPGNATVLET